MTTKVRIEKGGAPGATAGWNTFNNVRQSPTQRCTAAMCLGFHPKPGLAEREA
jgi:hypothetical protein